MLQVERSEAPDGRESSVPPGFWRCDLATDTLSWSDSVFDMFGFPRGANPDRRRVVELYRDDSREQMEHLRAQAIRTAQPFTLDAAIRCVQGKDRWLRITGIPVIQHGRVVALQGTKQDITAEREAWETMRQLALRDPVTGVANRWAFHQAFLDRPAGCRTLSAIEALVLFDMNRFKQINDGCGHQAGDACLAAFADRLTAAFPDAPLIARIGGDEFAVLLQRGGAARSAVLRITQALPALFVPLSWNGHILPVHAAFGIAMTRRDEPCDAAQLYALADADLYRAKALFRTRESDGAANENRAAG